MATFPTGIDTFSNPQGTTNLATDDHANQHRVAGSAIVAIENKVGTGSGSASANAILVGSGAGVSAWGTVWNSATLGTPRITGGTVSGAVIGTNQITGGTLAIAAIGTPTILGGTIAINGTAVPLTIGAALAPTMGTIADSPSGTFTPNAQAAQIHEITLGTTAGNRTFGTPANLVNGQFIEYKVKQNTNNTGTAVFSPIHLFSVASGTPTLGTQGTWNYISFRYSAVDSKLHFHGNILGLI